MQSGNICKKMSLKIEIEKKTQILNSHHHKRCFSLLSTFLTTKNITPDSAKMKSLSYLVIIFLIVASSHATRFGSQIDHLKNQLEKSNFKSSPNFDYLILRQIWPATTCMFPGPHSCSIAKNITTWVVHGLWYVIF